MGGTQIYLDWAPKAFFLAVLAVMALKYILRSRNAQEEITYPWLRLTFFRLTVALLVWRILFAVSQMYLQYLTWSAEGNILGQRLLPPYQSWNYFLRFSLGRFWLNILIAFAAALIFYIFLRVLKEWTPRFFETEEPELGFSAAFLSGWPGFAIFFPLVFIFIIVVSISRLLIWRQAYTTLGGAFILAVLVQVFWGEKFIQLFKLFVLRI